MDGRTTPSRAVDEASTSRPRRCYIPATRDVVLPKSRCSPKKFLHIVRAFNEEKKEAISGLGFGGLLQLSTTELKYDLCGWIISAFDVAYDRILLVGGQQVDIRPDDVTLVLGIPSEGEDVVVHNRRSTATREYSLRLIEQNLINLPVGADFLKSFLIFACAIIIAPISKVEGLHDLWDNIWDGDISIRRNWGKFLLQFLNDGIIEFRSKKPTYMRGSLIFLQLYYVTKLHLPRVRVPYTRPLAAPWTDSLIRKRLAAEVKLFGGYGHVEIMPHPGPTIHGQAENAPDGPAPTAESREDIQARLFSSGTSVTAIGMSITRDAATLRGWGSDIPSGMPGPSHHPSPPSDRDNSAVPPAASIPVDAGFSTPLGSIPMTAGIEMGVQSAYEHHPSQATSTHMQSPLTEMQKEIHDVQPIGDAPCSTECTKPPKARSFKQRARRLVKKSAACKSPFVALCMSQFPKIPHEERLVAEYALDEERNPSELLCDIHGMYITRTEMASLKGSNWVNSIVVSTFGRLLNGEQSTGALRHFFDPSFSVLLSSLSPKAGTAEIMDQSGMYFMPGMYGYSLAQCQMLFLPVCEENHWHVHVINLPASRVEILTSLPLRRGKHISAASRRLSSAVEMAFHAHGLHTNLHFSKFQHVAPDLVQQDNRRRCIFIG